MRGQRCLKMRAAQLTTGRLLALCIASSQVFAAVSVTISNPTANTRYNTSNPGATISYSGSFSWGAPDNSVDTVGVYSVLGGGGDPSVGSIISSNYGAITNKVNGPTSGSGDFSSANVTPALTAPTSGVQPFFVTARPENATQGLFWPKGRSNPAYFVTVNATTN